MKIRKNFIISGVLFLLFLLLTILVMKVDVQPIGPQQSTVGLASINQFVNEKFGVHLIWYNITDVLGDVAILVALGFGALGIVQLIKRKSLLKIDMDIILLGIYYVIVIATYVFFEIFIVNYRPIIIDGSLEASFPSSHTLLILCIMITAMLQLHKRIKNIRLRFIVHGMSIGVIVVTILGRLISGVHWVTDIVAGIILASALIMLYYSIIKVVEQKEED